MNSTDERYLPHLRGALPKYAHGYMSSGYSIALEGWRRGLDLKIKVNYQRKKAKVIEYVLSSKEKSHYFQITRGDLVSKEAVRICVNKDQTKEYLIKAGVEAPKGGVFEDNSTDEEILQYSKELGYPLVLKPTDGTGGKGVIANIKDDQEMLQAITYVRGKLGFKRVIVEQFFAGEDHRLYVVGDEVVGVFKRDPASVTGNGKDTIEELLKKKNEDRMKIPSLQNKPIIVNTETHELLGRLGYTMQSIPKQDEVVFLKTKSNVSSGGEAVDVTDDISEEMKKIAVAATKAIPTLCQAGVDMIIDKETNTGVVLEINSRAHIRTHLFPSYGKARDVPSAIIDYYFPETKGYDRENASKMYFDFDHVYKSFLKGATGYIEIPSIPTKIELKRFLFTANKFPEDLEEWIQTNAVKYNQSGFIKKLSQSKFSLILGGNQSEMDEFLTLLERKITRSKNDVDVEIKMRTTPVMQGFYVEEAKESSQKSKQNSSIIKKSKDAIKQNEKLKTENKKLRKKQEQLVYSTSWKVTKPLRAISRLFKQKS
ncbi:ATP-binding protein [Alkalihalobacterium chitinilyticum]|uniref:ATP-grasp domain-containing protein n=1 Tax=Alkalihalobacterium chitinilyticum TaxID=2980103 RepID=A0ABT5VK39_9BACI|nr:hypothetical protein [Alkalihalobacterium chitinilyticum]MDE5415823.1 hypothetical protein [Alkalihalobacterium chitinilyticum]